MSYRFFILSLLFFSLPAFSQMMGTWKGSGKLSYPDGRVADCMETTIVLKMRRDKLTFAHDYLLCDNLNFVIDDWENNYVIRNQSEVWVNDIVQVGLLTSDRLIFAASGELDEELLLQADGSLVYKLYAGGGQIAKFHLR